MNLPLHLFIDSSHQEMTVLDANDFPVYRFQVSTGKAGLGVENDSGKTPTGTFRICSKITSNQGLHTIFRSRIPRGVWPDQLPEGTNAESDFILTGILWLAGLDESNANTKARYIYIHGTHRTDLLGTPASLGCIRLSPENMHTLLDLVGEDTLVEII